MATLFPSGLDNFTNPTATSNLSDPGVQHHLQHANANDAIEAIQSKIGIVGSSVPSTHEYKISQLINGLSTVPTQISDAINAIPASNSISGSVSIDSFFSPSKLSSIVTGANTVSCHVEIQAALDACSLSGETLVFSPYEFLCLNGLVYSYTKHSIVGNGAVLRITASTSGSAFTFAAPHVTSNDYYPLWDSAKYSCNGISIKGADYSTSSIASLTGVMFGGSLSQTAAHACMVNCNVSGFDTCVQWSHHSYVQKIENCSFHHSNTALKYAGASLQDSGERIGVTNCMIFNSARLVDCAAGDMTFMNCSFDYFTQDAIYASAGSTVSVIGCHIEAIADSSLPWLTATGSHSRITLGETRIVVATTINQYIGVAQDVAGSGDGGVSDAGIFLSNTFVSFTPAGDYTQQSFFKGSVLVKNATTYDPGRYSASNKRIHIYVDRNNLLQDGSFDKLWNVTDEWAVTDAAGFVAPTFDSARFASGARALKFAPTSGNATKITKFFAVGPGAKPTVSFKLKGVLPAGESVSVSVGFSGASGYDADLASRTFTQVYDASMVNDSAWIVETLRPYSKAYVGATGFFVSFETSVSSGLMNFHLDDVIVEILDNVVSNYTETIDSLRDVFVPTQPAQDQVLSFVSANQKWMPKTLPTPVVANSDTNVTGSWTFSGVRTKIGSLAFTGTEFADLYTQADSTTSINYQSSTDLGAPFPYYRNYSIFDGKGSRLFHVDGQKKVARADFGLQTGTMTIKYDGINYTGPSTGDIGNGAELTVNYASGIDASGNLTFPFYRNFAVYDGKGGKLISVEGDTGKMTFVSSDFNIKDSITFQGNNTLDTFKTKVSVTEPTQNNDITIPNVSGTLAMVADLTSKQDALTSGSTIKTINGVSVLGAGNIVLAGTYPIAYVEDFGAIGDGVTNDAVAIQLALNSGAKTVLFDGDKTYAITAIIQIPSGVTVDFQGAKIIRKADVNGMFVNKSDGSIGGYDAGRNITIKNGVIDANGYASAFSAGNASGTVNGGGGVTPIGFGHCTDIVIENIEVVGVIAWHCIEINACKNALIKNCYLHDSGAAPNAEMIQIDANWSASEFPWFGPYSSTAPTMCDGVNIVDCTFENMSCAIGSHTSSKNYPASGNQYHKNVNISGCRFLAGATTAPAIKSHNWMQVNVVDNEFSNLNGGGVYNYSAGSTALVRTWVVANNRFTNIGGTSTASESSASSPPHAIWFASDSSTVWGHQGATITGNIIRTSTLSGIMLDGVDGATVVGNTVSDISGVGIWGTAIRNSVIANNVIRQANQAALRLGELVVGPGQVAVNVKVKGNIVANLYIDSASTAGVELDATSGGGGDVTLAMLSANTGAALIGTKASGTGAITRTVASKQAQIVFVEDFGALGDGSSNDAPAIQLAVRSGAKLVMFDQSKVYAISSGILVPSGVTLDFQGAKILRSGSSAYMFANDFDGTTGGYTANKNITLKNGVLDANGIASASSLGAQASNSTAITFVHATNVKVENCEIYGVFGYQAVVFIACNVGKVENCYIHDCMQTGGVITIPKAIGIEGAINTSANPTFSVNDNTMCNNISIKGCTFDAVWMGVGSHVNVNAMYHTSIEITGNKFFNISTGGTFTGAVKGQNWSSVNVSGNDFTNIYGTAVDLYAVGATTQCRNITVSSNRMTQIGGTNTAAEGDSSLRAIWIRADNITSPIGQKGISISGNIVKTSCRHGITVDAGESGSIVGNTVNDVAAAGLWLYNAKNFTVTGNAVFDSNVAGNRPGMFMIGGGTIVPTSVILRGNTHGSIYIWANAQGIVDLDPATMIGATASVAGVGGLVPLPPAGQQNSRLTGAGTWVAPEFGFVNLTNQALTSGSAAYVDVTGSSMTLTVGTWRIIYSVTTDHTASVTFTDANVVIANSANVIVEGSQSTRPGSNTAAVGMSKVIDIVVSTPTTYKMRISNGFTTGALTLLNTTLHKSTLAWAKLS
jgi:parallel beta-helix repeat protein